MPLKVGEGIQINHVLSFSVEQLQQGNIVSSLSHLMLLQSIQKLKKMNLKELRRALRAILHKQRLLVTHSHSHAAFRSESNWLLYTTIQAGTAGSCSPPSCSTEPCTGEHCGTQFNRGEKPLLTLFLSKISSVTSLLYLRAVFPAGWLGSFSWLNCPPGS